MDVDDLNEVVDPTPPLTSITVTPLLRLVLLLLLLLLFLASTSESCTTSGKTAVGRVVPENVFLFLSLFLSYNFIKQRWEIKTIILSNIL